MTAVGRVGAAVTHLCRVAAVTEVFQQLFRRRGPLGERLVEQLYDGGFKVGAQRLKPCEPEHECG
jgi:hypothetical protein